MSSRNDSNDLKFWLKEALHKEELRDFTVNILGNSEKGDGYMGDIVFVHLDGKTANDQPKSLDLVLKCSKKSQVLRDQVPVKCIFENEIYTYTRVFPEFKQFQAEKGVDDVFDSVSPCFGDFSNENMEVLVLQNLRVLGYRVQERRRPLDSPHLELLLKEYGKLHAISGAMQVQRPEEFKVLVDGIKDVWREMRKSMDINKTVINSIEEMYEVIKDDAEEHVARKLLDFRNQVDFIYTKLIYDRTHFSVINHGDCWNNNFMFLYKDADDSDPLKVAMLDWQISIFSNPITDLSYFLYVCASGEDLKNLEGLLKVYHASFSNHVRKLGSDPEKIFSYSELLQDWKIFAKFGFMMAMFIIKIALSDKDEVKDMTETLESGGDLSSTFVYEIKDKDKLKERVLAIVEHAVNSGVI